MLPFPLLKQTAARSKTTLFFVQTKLYVTYHLEHMEPLPGWWLLYHLQNQTACYVCFVKAPWFLLMYCAASKLLI